MIITISGTPGSGKSTVAKILAARLKFKHYSVGDMRGKMALERGMTIDELNRLGETEAFTDNDVDEYQKTLGEKENNFVIDSRLGFYFIPHSYKVFLTVSEKIAAERILKAPKRLDEPEYRTMDDVLNKLRERVESDKKRYQKYYTLDYTDRKQYNLVIDTSSFLPEQVADLIIKDLQNKKLIG
ncbi:cytidylate kinase family protein [Candidatus Woesearchaeota archaeon]|nr:cytidylate kinase family protein [Candidatus Woesearchaeota archaeon]